MGKIETIINNKKARGEYRVDNTPVKVIGVGPEALKILVLESSKFTATPVWKQQWINFRKDCEEKSTQDLFDLIIEKINKPEEGQQTL